MASSPSNEEIEKALIFLRTLDETIQQGPWEDSLFLRGIGKKLREIREKYVTDLGIADILAETSTLITTAPQTSLDTESIEVYVTLYQAEGNNLRKWTTIVAAIAQLSITRPVYASEEDVISAIRTKDYKVNDAYVAVKVGKGDILKPVEGKAPVDRYGHELLVLRENAIRLENVTRFVHLSGQYQFTRGALIKLTETEKKL
jgi:intracellular multiplication protein IcmQ